MDAPLRILSAQDAVNNRKTNPAAEWGNRAAGNRVEPVAKPEFDVPFRLTPGQRIFTIGSCFARNVESELQRRGFVIPAIDLLKTPEFEAIGTRVLNNYGTPSIYNELAWAFGEQTFEPKDHILEAMPGKFVDMHLGPGIKPEAWEEAKAKRDAITNAYRLAATCEVAIITLGLAETWFDTRTGFYVNAAPRPGMIRNEPDRFQLHVLSYQNTYDYLKRALEILRRHAPEMRVILTVSPVPLNVTHRPIDVMVANTYSKSVLRTAAEEAVVRHDFVTYFPSYESVTLSDRKLAWRDDLRHVTDDLVAFNVGRMIDAFVDGTVANLATRAQQAAVIASVEPQKALDLLDGEESLNADLIRAEALLALDRAAEAYALVNRHCIPHLRLVPPWKMLIQAALARADRLIVEDAIARTKLAVPARAIAVTRDAERWLSQNPGEGTGAAPQSLRG